MKINEPAILAELKICHESYEEAVRKNDSRAVEALLWSSHEARFMPPAESAPGTARKIERLHVVAFGDSAGLVNLEFTSGRETQIWIRFTEGWRLASSHASENNEAAYLKAAAAAIGLKIADEYKAEVNENLSRVAAMAEFLLQFPLSQEVEAAPVFYP
jgi:hypothetical protein